MTPNILKGGRLKSFLPTSPKTRILIENEISKPEQQRFHSLGLRQGTRMILFQLFFSIVQGLRMGAGIRRHHASGRAGKELELFHPTQTKN